MDNINNTTLTNNSQLNPCDFENLFLSCEKLWMAPNIKIAITTFLLNIEQLTPLQSYILFKIAKDQVQPLSAKSVKLHTIIKMFSEDLIVNFLQTITPIIQNLNLKQEIYKGLNSLCIKQQTIFFSIINELDSFMIIGFIPKNNLLFNKHYPLYDFWAKQLQILAHIFIKLTSAEQLLYKDDLTNVYNFRYLNMILDNEVKRSQRFNTSFSLLFIDIDDFKQINDCYGHLVGSYILQQISLILKSNLRKIDSIIRYGGDEFIILLLGSNTKSALNVAERIRYSVEMNRFHINKINKSIQITVSIGVANYPEHANSKKDLLQIADYCMYESKRNGKNKVSVFKTKHKSNNIFLNEKDIPKS